jgi:maleylpyruvate isomerase
VEYHHLDLAVGYRPAGRPDDFVATELARVTSLMDMRTDAPSMTLTGLAVLHISTSPPIDVTGDPAAMLAWLSGRSDGSSLDADGSALPALPPLA